MGGEHDHPGSRLARLAQGFSQGPAYGIRASTADIDHLEAAKIWLPEIWVVDSVRAPVRIANAAKGSAVRQQEPVHTGESQKQDLGLARQPESQHGEDCGSQAEQTHRSR